MFLGKLFNSPITLIEKELLKQFSLVDFKLSLCEWLAPVELTFEKPNFIPLRPNDTIAFHQW